MRSSQGFQVPADDASGSGYGCNVCKRRSLAYKTYEQCLAGEKAFLPEGAGAPASPSAPGSMKMVYPKLLLPRLTNQVLKALGASSCPPAVQPTCQDFTGWARWEQLFGSAGPRTDVVLPEGRKVVLHGCAQPGNAVSVQSITVPADATVSWQSIEQAALFMPSLEAEPVSWQAGDDVLLVTTAWKDELSSQNEVLRIIDISSDGKVIKTRQRLQHNHYAGEYQAEVALLSRRILFTTDDRSFNPSISKGELLGVTGWAIGLNQSTDMVCGGKYPIHFHLVGDTSNAFVKNTVFYNSNWRCVTLHATNGVYLYGNIGFNVFGHCFYLEDGVEERNVLEHNLAAFIHPLQMAGFKVGFMGTDRFANGGLFDPTDSAAAGFYALNKHNTWLNNAASGGFSGFTFPRAPRAIKESQNAKMADGMRPFNPSKRPFVLFKGNTAHSSGWAGEHAACIYFGGVIYYATDPKDGVLKLYYNNGRQGTLPPAALCPDPTWPSADKDNANADCFPHSIHNTKDDSDANAFIKIEGVTTALCAVGIAFWGARVEVNNLQAYDVNRAVNLLQWSYLSNSYIKINTTNSQMGWVEFYDMLTAQMLDNVTFDNYKYLEYPTSTDPTDTFWGSNTPHAIRFLGGSDKYKPMYNQIATRMVRCVNCDLGSAAGPYKGAFFKVEPAPASSTWFFNLFDTDGSIVRHAQPDAPTGPHLIASYPDWWNLGPSSWKEQSFKGTWITPMPANLPDCESVARVDMKIISLEDVSYTLNFAVGAA
eukprot:gene4484-4738_t